MEECLRKKLVEMIRLATLAPSPYNTQPWKFSITSREIQIHPDLSRHLSVMDPEKRELYISLGCALENLTIAMENQGFNPQVRYHLGQDFDEHLKATFRNGKKGNNSILFNAISKRRSNPSFLDSRPISMQDQNLLLSLPLEEGVAVHWLNSQQELQTIRDIARTAIGLSALRARNPCANIA